MSRRWKSMATNSRSYIGADTGSKHGSDHLLVKLDLKLRLAARPKRKPPRRFDTNRFDDPNIRQAFCLELSNRFEALQVQANDEQTQSLDEEWLTIRNTIHEAAEATIGYRKRLSKKWMSTRTIQLAEHKQQISDRKSELFKRLRRECHQSAKNDKNQYWEKIAEDMEAAASRSDTRKMYQLLKSIRSKSHKPTSTSVEDENGKLLSNNTEIINRWKEHFDKLLNQHQLSTAIDDNQRCHNPSRSPDDLQEPNSPSSIYNDVNVAPPTLNEVQQAINCLKSNKAPGPDAIPAELYKYGGTALVSRIHKLTCRIWEEEMVPQDWGDSIILPVFKKGLKTKCSNYRGISLICIAAKIFAIVLHNRFRIQRNAKTRPNQAGFRPGMGTIDQLFVLRQTLEHRAKHQKPTVSLFIDFITAFDSVLRDGIWKAMTEDGVPGKIVRLIQAYYQHTRAQIQIGGELSSMFQIDFGVRQGCILSPVLFNFVIDWIMTRAMTTFSGVEVSPNFVITDLDYADDICLLAESRSEAQSMLSKVAEESSLVGLKISSLKTKVMASGISSQDPPILLEQSPIDEIHEFKYLGSLVDPIGGCTSEIQSRIASATGVFTQLNHSLWNQKNVRLKTRIRIYQALVRSVLLYGCETWTMKASDIQALNVFDHSCLRRIIGTKLRDRVSNVELRKICYQRSDLATIIKQRRLRWFGHTLRRPHHTFVNKALRCTPLSGWKKRHGGQKKTWLACIKADLDPIGGFKKYGRRWEKSWLDLIEPLANDRDSWLTTMTKLLDARESGDA